MSEYIGRNLLAALISVFCLMGTALGGVVYEEEGDDPEVTDRVARISFIRGDVQIRRADTEEWENAVLNLPIVEGDEVVTGNGSLVEIQAGIYQHIRLSGDSYLRLVTLDDGGVAISISQGTVSVRLTEFDAGSTFFEIDAPQTTISLQTSGRYRVDAGKAGDPEIRVSIGDEGEARVYSLTSGFTLRSGRSATVFTEGESAGEWMIGQTSLYNDEFDNWVLEREAVAARALRDAKYDVYYDRDIYGAEDLNYYGDWVYTNEYGYLWSPWDASIRSYRGWSPYLYGHWRFIPVYGWVWVNDEPWGWATYHYGRWVWHNSRWYWTPYGYYRTRRSWWRPALVVVTIFNNNVCWYPLPYHNRYYDYNRHYYRNRRERIHRNKRENEIIGRTTANRRVKTEPVRTTPPPTGQPPSNEERRGLRRTPPLQRVPPGSVVAVPAGDFGRRRGGYGRLPVAEASRVIAKKNEGNETPPILPTINEMPGNISPDIRAERPQIVVGRTLQPVTGAGVRRQGSPLDDRLRQTRIFGGRTPRQSGSQPDSPQQANDDRPPLNETPERREDTGVFERRVPRKVERTGEPRPGTPIIAVPPRPSAERKTEQPGETTQEKRETPRTRREARQPQNRPEQAPPKPVSPPVKSERVPERREQPRRESPPWRPPAPRSEPKEQPRRESPPQKSEPPPRREPPKGNPAPRNVPPPKSESVPKNLPAPKIEPRKPRSDSL